MFRKNTHLENRIDFNKQFELLSELGTTETGLSEANHTFLDLAQKLYTTEIIKTLMNQNLILSVLFTQILITFTFYECF